MATARLTNIAEGIEEKALVFLVHAAKPHRTRKSPRLTRGRRRSSVRGARRSRPGDCLQSGSNAVGAGLTDAGRSQTHLCIAGRAQSGGARQRANPGYSPQARSRPPPSPGRGERSKASRAGRLAHRRRKGMVMTEEPPRLASLRKKLKARAGKKEYEENCEHIRAEITRDRMEHGNGPVAGARVAHFGSSPSGTGV
jgi:hypothetical protein